MKLKKTFPRSIAALFLILAVSCSKTNNNDNNGNNNTTGTGPDCYISKLDLGQSYQVYSYNANNNLLSVTLYDSGLGTIQISNKLSYNGPNAALSRIDLVYPNGPIPEYHSLNYNADGTVGSSDDYFDTTGAGTGPLVKRATITYTYLSGHISRENLYNWHGSHQQLTGYYTFYYDANGNDTAVYGFTATGTLALTHTYTFDNKKSPNSNSKYIQYLAAGSIVNPNNVLSYHQNDALGNNTYSYSYQYNTEGYPTKSTATLTGINFISTMSYICK